MRKALLATLLALVALAATPASAVASTTTLAAINAARQQEGITPMVLPVHFDTLDTATQAFVVADLERVDRGLPAIAGMITGGPSDGPDLTDLPSWRRWRPATVADDPLADDLAAYDGTSDAHGAMLADLGYGVYVAQDTPGGRFYITVGQAPTFTYSWADALSDGADAAPVVDVPVVDAPADTSPVTTDTVASPMFVRAMSTSTHPVATSGHPIVVKPAPHKHKHKHKRHHKHR